MSAETAPQQSHEALPTGKHELLEAPKPSHEKLEHVKHSHEQMSNQAAEAVAEAYKAADRAEKATDPAERLAATQEAAQHVDTAHVINQELKDVTLQRELKVIRRKLSVTDRGLSRVIHQPVIRAVSEGASKTVSRPSGLLGGGLVALLGSSVYLYMAKHLGFQYNYGVFLVLFVGGFAVGLVLELFVSMATRSRRSQD